MSSVSFSNLSTRANEFLAGNETINSFKQGAKKVSDFVEENSVTTRLLGFGLMGVGIGYAVALSGIAGFGFLFASAYFIPGFLAVGAVDINRAARNYFNISENSGDRIRNRIRASLQYLIGR